LGVGPGDEVVVTPRSFIASVGCVITVGAKPVFADVDPDSGNITADSIAKVLTKKTRAIIPVHLAGWPCEMDAIITLAKDHGLFVIEDCAQAHGAEYNGKKVGSIGHVGAWSFCQDKIMTTGGEGGMLTTNDGEVWNYAWSYKDHGKSYQAMNNGEEGNCFKWVHHSIGTNWRMIEMQAAIGRIQLKKLDQWHLARRANAQAILAAARQCPALRVPEVPSHIEHAWYKCYVYVRPEALSSGWSRDRIVAEINKQGVPCYTGSCSEIYLEKAFDVTGLRPEKRLALAKQLGETSVMFVVHPTLTQNELHRTCSTLTDVVSKATR
ncbi:MAG TPA: DegT/DnrJ/EryC1/StrS aminotransferase family protein, partial [bacterium]|nr:DegT/DnrJ/EryC1/StrS aminotransferase family protein [bacterium]